jgi:hypothetical protein
MARAFWYAVPILLGTLALPASGAAIYGDITVNVEPEPKGNGTHGYTEYQVSVTNKSSQRSHRVRLTIPKTIGYHPRLDYVREISRTVDVGPEATVRVSLFQPGSPAAYGTGMNVNIDGRDQDESVPLNVVTVRSQLFAPGTHSAGIGPLVLYSRGVGNDFPELANKLTQINQYGNVLPMHGVQFARAETPLAEWSTNWLGYSRYGGVVLSGDELRRAPAAVQAALWQYVECGGSLLVLGSGTVAASWKRTTKGTAGCAVYRPAFGECLVSTDTDFALWPGERWKLVGESWTTTTAPLRHVRSPADANRIFPVIEEVGVPVRGLFALMILFAVLIGPVNLLVLGRLNRRIWLLWTAPAISLLTCAAVFGYMLVSEGWSGHLRTEGLTILDESSHRAATIGWTAFYTPVAPSDGLHFGYDTELAPQNVQDQRHSGTACTLDWTNEQHLASGWVTARVPAHFLVRKNEVRRERITVNRGKDGALTIVNALGADLQQFWYADEQLRIYRAAGPVPSGSQAVLTPTESTLHLEGAAGDLRPVFAAEWNIRAESYTGNPQRFLLPRGYVAVLDTAPFIEDGLRNARTRKYRTLVVGLPRDPKESGDES